MIREFSCLSSDLMVIWEETRECIFYLEKWWYNFFGHTTIFDLWHSLPSWKCESSFLRNHTKWMLKMEIISIAPFRYREKTLIPPYCVCFHAHATIVFPASCWNCSIVKDRAVHGIVLLFFFFLISFWRGSVSCYSSCFYSPPLFLYYLPCLYCLFVLSGCIINNLHFIV